MQNISIGIGYQQWKTLVSA